MDLLDKPYDFSTGFPNSNEVPAFVDTLIADMNHYEWRTTKDIFWDRIETVLIQSCFFYLIAKGKENHGCHVHLPSVLDLLEENTGDTLDQLFEELKKEHPNHIATICYTVFNDGCIDSRIKYFAINAAHTHIKDLINRHGRDNRVCRSIVDENEVPYFVDFLQAKFNEIDQSNFLKRVLPHGFESMEPYFLKACIYYLIAKDTENHEHHANLLTLLELLKENLWDTDILFEEFEKEHPNHIAVKNYRAYQKLKNALEVDFNPTINVITRLNIFLEVIQKESDSDRSLCTGRSN